MSLGITSIRIQYEHDVVACRQRARQVAEALGFEKQQQTRLATAVSEIARNAYMYGGGGQAEFLIEGATAPQLLSIRITDQGRGISNLEEILEGRYQSQTGMGLGLSGARRLMDKFTVSTVPGKGTEVVMGKLMPRRVPVVTERTLPAVVKRIEVQAPRDILDEFREQNRELMRTLDELRRRQDELQSLNRELEDTNRGVVALYAELDERADHLKRADEIKSRFLSNMSHEFRTPLSSILALSRLLAERTDGELTPEQEIQVSYIRKSAESLFEIVNDLLDLAKVEAGKIVVRPVEFEASGLFGALRGMLRPLLMTSSLKLVFEDAADCPPVYSDEGKVSQILRNFISNALKFTEAGEVRVKAECTDGGDFVSFHVRDTGIGIPEEHRDAIFQEFAQVDSPIQRRVRGTGLGLPLSRKLAELLGGSVRVASEVGTGSTFSLRIPRIYRAAESAPAPPPDEETDNSRLPVLLVEDRFEIRLVYTQYLRDSPWQIISARTTREAESVLRTMKPAAILLDILLEGEDTWDFLAGLKSDRTTSSIPVVVATEVDDGAKAMALGADAFTLKPIERQTLIRLLREVTGRHLERTVLLIGGEEVSRYLLKQMFRDSNVRFLEAADGAEGLSMARQTGPDLVVVDVDIPAANGFDAIEEMRADPKLEKIPVIVSAATHPPAAELRRIDGGVLAILTKDSLSRTQAREKIESALRAAGLEDLIPGAEAAQRATTR